jgi:hypothetical protein
LDRSINVRRFLAASGLIVVIALISVVGYLVRNWPFRKAEVTKALQDRFARQVEIRDFYPTYFPPGCVADGVSFLHRKRKDLPPLITVQSLRIRGSYIGLLRIHKSVPDIQLVGLHVTIPPKTREGTGGPQTVMPLTNSTSGKQLGIDELATQDALLEFLPSIPIPFRMEDHRQLRPGVLPIRSEKRVRLRFDRCSGKIPPASSRCPSVRWEDSAEASARP